MSPHKKTPKELGYRMPAEWAPHLATWLAWPHNTETWPVNLLQAVQSSFALMAAALSTGERVEILVPASDLKIEALQLIRDHEHIPENIHFLERPVVDAWIRDYGPNFLTSTNGTAFNHWIFNAWGAKYQSLMEDNQIPSLLNDYLNMPCFNPGIVLEGGSIEVNGEGLCITTKQCLLNKNRNPHLSQKQIEQVLYDYLDVEQIIWLEKGIEGDDTDGHIDDIARFVNPNTLLIASQENPKNEDHNILRENLLILEHARDQKGLPFQIITLPMPERCIIDGLILPASYANFYIANAVVLFPGYDKKKDPVVMEILQHFFPEKRIVNIPSKEMVYGLGSIHCVTQQQPKI